MWTEEVRARLALPVAEWWSLVVKRAFEAQSSEAYQIKLDVDAALRQIERLRLDLREAVRGGAVLARERNEAVRQRDIVSETVERLTWVIKGAHGALTDAGTVVVPGVLDGDIGTAIRQLTCERDEARAEVERLRAYVGSEMTRSDFRTAADMRAEVERLRHDSAEWSTIAETQRTRAERAEAALRKTLAEVERPFRARIERAEAALAEWRKHDSAPDCVACAVLDAALAEGEDNLTSSKSKDSL